MTKVEDDMGILEPILEAAGCIGPYDNLHRCSALHCDHCGVCDVTPEILRAYKDRLQSLKNKVLAEKQNSPDYDVDIDHYRRDSYAKRDLVLENHETIDAIAALIDKEMEGLK